ncbi:mCG1042174, partial [Mus musculus]
PSSWSSQRDASHSLVKGLSGSLSLTGSAISVLEPEGKGAWQGEKLTALTPPLCSLHLSSFPLPSYFWPL